MSIRTALNIWNDIEKTWGEQLNIHYEGRKIVALHGLDKDQDVIDYLSVFIKRLEVYKETLEDFYGIKKPKSKKHNTSVSPKMSYVYLMKNIRNGYHKIGRSINPEYRERTLQSEAPEIEIVFVSPLCFSINEKKLHNYFSDKRIRGEWFNLSEEDVNFIKSYQYGS